MAKKVLFVITKSGWGGSQRYVYDLATHLPDDAFEVAVALGGTGEKDAKAGLLQKKLEKGHIRTIFIAPLMRDISLVQEMRAFFAIRKIIREEKPDVLHLNSSKVGGLGALAGRLSGVPLVLFTVHGWAFNESRSFLQKTLFKVSQWATVLLCHKTIVVSQMDALQVKYWPFMWKKLTVIHNGIPKLQFETREQARESLHVPKEAFVIGTLGELTWNKNYATLISAIALLKEKQKDFILTIMGEGEERYNIVRAIKNSAMFNGRDVELKGLVEDGYKYLPAYDIFILPSLKEGLPYALLEAGQAGLPVVASNVGGISEIVNEKVTGLLIQDPKNPKEIAWTLSRYMDEPALGEKLGSALKEKIIKEFSLEEMLAQTTSIYQN